MVILKFDKKGITLEKPIKMPIIGETVHKEFFSYDQMPTNGLNGLKINEITPTIKGDTLISLEFGLEEIDSLVVDSKKNKRKSSNGKKANGKAKNDLSQYKRLGSVLSPKKQIKTTIFQDKDAYYFSSETAKKHKLLCGIAKKTYDAVTKEVKGSPMPQTYAKLRDHLKQKIGLSQASFQAWMIVALYKEHVKAVIKNGVTFLSLT